MNTVRDGVLVTGATGFIGYHVTRALSQDPGLRTVCIVRQCSNVRKTDGLRRLGVDLVEGSFLDPDDMGRLFASHSIKYVVHMAALRGGGAGSREEYSRINVDGTETLLRLSLSHGVHRFVFCSSVGVFGTIPRQLPAGEGTPLHGDNRYHASKIEAERRVAQYAAQGLDARIIRPTITYGREDDGFPATLVKLVRQRRLVLCSGDVRIHLLDVGRLAAFIHQVLRRERLSPNIFIVADRAPISLKQLVDRIHRHYCGVEYPSHLSMPGLMFKAAAFFFKLIGNEKWLARVRLISESWYFDLSGTIAALPGFEPARTDEQFVPAMCVDHDVQGALQG